MKDKFTEAQEITITYQVREAYTRMMFETETGLKSKRLSQIGPNVWLIETTDNRTYMMKT